MSQHIFKGNFILNGHLSIISINENNELSWVHSSIDDSEYHQNDQIYRRSAKFKLARQTKINFSSLISIKICYCSRSPLRRKKSIQCNACLDRENHNNEQNSLLNLPDEKENEQYNSAKFSSIYSSSKSPSPISGESLQSDSSLGFVDAESSNESGTFSAQSASSLIKLAVSSKQSNEMKSDEQSQLYSGRKNKTGDWTGRLSKYGNVQNCSIKVIKLFYVIEKRGSHGRLLVLKSLIIKPPPTHDSDTFCKNSQNTTQTTQTTLDQLAAKLQSITKTTQYGRPKSLLIFINPFGGKGRALEIYKTKVEYIFKIANINTEVIVTEYANHAREMIENPATDLNKYNGIICVGGDGMFGELMNGILFRANKKYMTNNEYSSYEKNNLNASEIAQLKAGLGGIGRKLEVPSIPIGVIGAGSTDANSFGVIGTNDATTAALNMVLGKKINIDICSVHSLQEDHKILRFVSTLVSYGYFGDIIKNSDSLRWMGPKRYDICAAQNILKHRSYSGEIKILLSPSDGTPSDGSRCDRNCTICFDSSNVHESLHNEGNKVIKYEQIQDGKTYKFGRDEYEDKNNNNNNNNEDNSGKSHENIQRSNISNSYEECTINNDHMAFSSDGRLLGDNISPQEKGSNQNDGEDYVLIQKRGSFIGINTAIMACRCPQTKKGLSPKNHLGNGCADLILVSSCSRMQYLNYLLRTGWTKKSPFDLEFVEAYRCRQFDFIATPNRQEIGNTLDQNGDTDEYSSWNVDGELLSEPSIRVKVNCQLLPVFGNGEPNRLHRSRRAQNK